ncbi:hypothetical protein [Jeotgalibacillus proteolyticus]|uniref:Uncharacterized protein n=1 Tax=Jeotgalibacillus proteolyticus TaxID=2082395 RepID=A0A2S5G638_9BACL|nr:hypothetical protein [Jeotgalibacillus proteolyticus]PPA68436.1 hypothetical protein C4B60_20950 [Jeotgalibacillus proteolyticus]
MFYKEGMNIEIEALNKLFIEMGKNNKSLDLPLVELQDALEEIDANRNKLYSEYEPQGQINAFYHNGEFYFAPAYLKEKLGINEKQIRSIWMQRGLTETYINRNNQVDYKVIKKNKRTFRAILVKKHALEQLGFDFS